MNGKWQEHFHQGLALIGQEQYADAIVQLSQALVEAADDAVAKCYATRGYAYLCTGDLARAIDDCNQAIEHDPSDGEAYAWRGSGFAGQQLWPQAIDDYVEAIRLAPDKEIEYRHVLEAHLSEAIKSYSRKLRGGVKSPHVLRDRGIAYAIRGDHDNAVRDFSQAISQGLKDADCYAHRALSHLAAEEYKKAISDCTTAIKLGDGRAEIYFARARALRATGHNDHAVADLTQVIKLDPYYAAAYFERGLAQQSRGATDAALGDVSSAIQLDASMAEYYLARAELNNDRADFSVVVADYTAALQLAPPDQAETYVKRGEAYFHLQRGNEAIADFDTAIGLHAVCAPAYRGRGLALQLQGDFAAAAAELTKAIRLDSRYGAAYESRADLYLEMEDYAQAIADYGKVLQLTRDDAEAASLYSRRGVAQLDSGNLEAAVSDFSAAIDRDPRDADSHAWRGAARARQSRYQEAIDDILAAMELSPERAEEYRAVGEPYGQQAIAYFDRLIAREPDNPQWHRGRGVCYEFCGDGAAALRDYNKAIELAPHDSETYLRRGRILARGGRFDRAAEDFSKSIELGDERAVCRHHRGLCYLKVGRLKDALADLNRALQLDNADPRFYRDRAEVLAAAKNYQRAEVDFTKSIELGPNDARPYFGRGFIYALQKKFDRAIADYSQAIAHDPNHAVAYLRRGEALASIGQQQKAMNDFNAAIALDKMLVAAHCGRGLALAKAGRYNQAVIELTKACGYIRFDLRFAAAFESRARVYVRMGQFRRALVDYSHVLHLDPPNYPIGQTFYGMGMAHLYLQEFDPAGRCFAQVLKKNPGHSAARDSYVWIQSDRKRPLATLRPPERVIQIRMPPVLSQRIELEAGANEWNVETVWDQWLVRVDGGQEFGPFRKRELDALCAGGRLKDSTLLLRIDWDQWRPAGDVYFELTFETHRSANRPIPVESLPPVPEAAPEDPADAFPVEGIGIEQNPGDDEGFPGIKV